MLRTFDESLVTSKASAELNRPLTFAQSAFIYDIYALCPFSDCAVLAWLLAVGDRIGAPAALSEWHTALPTSCSQITPLPCSTTRLA
jgi:hypothetical protein